jgi:RHS repeat-associated protein
MGYHVRNAPRFAPAHRRTSESQQPASSPKPHTPLRQVSTMGARYYSPKFGRWISPDPIGERGGENLYALVRNSPVSFVDWLGQATAGERCCCSDSGTPALRADLRYGIDGYHIYIRWVNFRNEGGGCYSDVSWIWWTCYWGYRGYRYPNANVDEEFDPDARWGGRMFVTLYFTYLSCVDGCWRDVPLAVGGSGGCWYNRWYDPGPDGWVCQ